jgi:diacylglycerol kinase family enzyme
MRKVDLGCCTYNTDRGVQKRYFLNVLNIGLSAKIVEVANKNNTIFSKLVYKVCGFVYLLFRRQNFHMRFKLNSQVVDRRFMMLCIGNSTGYGMTPSAVPYNGWIDVSAIKMSPFLGMLEGMRMLMKRRILNFKRVEPFRTTEICIESVDNALAGIDGRLFYPTYPMTVTAEPEKLNLIIPTKINRKL